MVLIWPSLFSLLIPVLLPVLLPVLRPVLCLESEKINLTTTFMLQEERVTHLLIPHLCWDFCSRYSLIKTVMAEGRNVASSTQEDTTEYSIHFTLVVVDLSCNHTDRYLKQASDHGLFRSPYRWLIFEGMEDSTRLLQDLDILVDSEVVIVRKTGRQDYLLIEAYKISNKSEVIFNLRSVWKPADQSSNITAVNSTSVYTDSELRELFVCELGVMEEYRVLRPVSTRRRDLRRHVLTMANVITDSNDTREHLEDRLNLNQDSITKMSFAVVKLCFEMLNATERRLFTHTWGYKDKYGNWQGVVNHLLRNEADLGTLTIFTKERMQAIDYIAMVGSTSVRFVFREPPLSLVSNIFYLPFSAAVWTATFVCVLSCSIFLYITSKWEARFGMHHQQLDGSWADVLILIIGAVLQQGCYSEPRYAPGRCVTFLLFMTLTFLYAAYAANIVVLLRAPSSSVRSLPDLLNSPLTAGASDFEYNRYFFKKLNDPIRKAIYDKKISPKGKKPQFYSMEEGISRIRKGLFAFHMELNPGYRLIQDTFMEHEKCDLVEIDYINEIDPWVPGQKRSPFKDLFKINFLRIRECGLQSCVRSRLTVPRPKCSGSVATFSSVGITDLYPAMLITLYGFLLAPSVLLIEILYHRLMVSRDHGHQRSKM